MLYNVALLIVSAVQQCGSAVSIHICPLSCASLPTPDSHPSRASQKTPRWVPWAIQQLPSSSLVYTWYCMFVSTVRSIRPDIFYAKTVTHTHTSFPLIAQPVVCYILYYTWFFFMKYHRELLPYECRKNFLHVFH